MKNSFLFFIFYLLPCTVFSQNTDSYVDSLFYENMDFLNNKCMEGEEYYPYAECRKDLHEFLHVFSFISGLHLIGICWEPTKVDCDGIDKLYNWYNKYGHKITKQLYLQVRRMYDIHSFTSIYEMSDYTDWITEKIEKIFPKYPDDNR